MVRKGTTMYLMKDFRKVLKVHFVSCLFKENGGAREYLFQYKMCWANVKQYSLHRCDNDFLAALFSIRARLNCVVLRWYECQLVVAILEIIKNRFSTLFVSLRVSNNLLSGGDWRPVMSTENILSSWSVPGANLLEFIIIFVSLTSVKSILSSFVPSSNIFKL